jgi:hypothetical protein
VPGPRDLTWANLAVTVSSHQTPRAAAGGIRGSAGYGHEKLPADANSVTGMHQNYGASVAPIRLTQLTAAWRGWWRRADLGDPDALIA